MRTVAYPSAALAPGCAGAGRAIAQACRRAARPLPHTGGRHTHSARRHVFAIIGALVDAREYGADDDGDAPAHRAC